MDEIFTSLGRTVVRFRYLVVLAWLIGTVRGGRGRHHRRGRATILQHNALA